MENVSSGSASPTGQQPLSRKIIVRSLIFLAAFCLLFSVFVVPMGLANALNTLMNTSYRLLMDTSFYIMAIAVMAGAICSLFTAYGVVDLLNRILSPLMRPLFGMPGAAALGIVTTYLSDNPAILSLAGDHRYLRYFKAYQVPALTNLGTSFGMGLIVTTFVLGLGTVSGESTVLAAVCGNLGAICGSILSTRLMMHFTAKSMGREAPADLSRITPPKKDGEEPDPNERPKFLSCLMEGGKKGVEQGMGIIPGVLIICTLVMMLTNGMPEGGYTGAAFEGVGLLPRLADHLDFILKPLFGFSSAADIAVPVTALGSAGAAMGVIPSLVMKAQANCNDLAVFTAMCMCWSGYLSTHVSMMDVLGCTKFTGKAILSHTIGGIVAGVSAHWIYVLFSMIF